MNGRARQDRTRSTGSSSRLPPRPPDHGPQQDFYSALAESLDAALARTGEMNIEQLRTRWREAFASDPPAALSKDLMARAICHRLQEQAFGGLSASDVRLLRSLVKPGAEVTRLLKVGSVLIREHQGVVHKALVVPGGFCWQGQTYDSLSTIAKTITGTGWNGPRFFGLRSKKMPDQEEGAATGRASVDRKPQPSSRQKASSRSGRRSAVQAASGDEGARQ